MHVYWTWPELPLHNLAKIYMNMNYMNMFTTGQIKQIRTKDIAFWPGVMAQCLRTLALLPEDLSLVFSTHTE